MARSIVARRQGDDFQSRLFWLKAASLLDPHSPVIRVSYETGPKSFDDLTVEYDPKQAPPDHEGLPIYCRHIQCKWHTTAGAFGYEDLVDPAFINAARHSLLENARHAQSQLAPAGTGRRFEFLTNWRIRDRDPLQQLVRKESDALDLNRLFDGTTDRSRMGRVRRLWCDHLGIDHAALNFLARSLAIAETPESLSSLRERLDERFAAVGMKRVPSSETAFFYDDLAGKLLAQGRISFDRKSFRAMADKEGLLDPAASPANLLAIGVRSFMHPINALEERCSRMLNLVPHFDGRYIRNDSDWQDQIHPALLSFLTEAAQSAEELQLILDVHVSLAFAAGAVLNVKSGKRIEIEQRFAGRQLWSVDDQPANPDWSRLEFDEEEINRKADGIALAIGLTHDVAPGVRRFFAEKRSDVGRIVHCRPKGGPSQQSVVCGRHAATLAESVVQHVRDLRCAKPSSDPLSLFIAGPNAFAFFLGQHRQALGPSALYEWDFDGQRGGGYSVGLIV